MKQLLQHLRTGRMELAELPCPPVQPGMLLIQTRKSVISAGTERMLVEFSRANLIQKARQQPEKVKQVLDKIKTDGLMPTLETVFRKLDEPLPLGYCNAGVVLEVGPGVDDVLPGDRVISNGNHAELVCVPRHLSAKIPQGVSDEQAAFTVLGSIALQGIRLAEPSLGEKFTVFGMGLLGLLTVQLLQATGCEVLAVDLNPRRLKLAESFGAKVVDLSAGGDPVAAASAWTSGVGVDGVLITASAKTDQIVHQAAESCRKRGRIVLVGVVDLNLRRSDFYEKELSFQVSCSYGPGRYDEKYERAGHDYPLGYVRWTEQRNFEAVLGAIEKGSLRVEEMITDRYPFDNAPAAYERIQNDAGVLGVILEYADEPQRAPVVEVTPTAASAIERPVVGLIGAGGFAKGILLPFLAKTGASLGCVADLDVAAARYAAAKFGIGKASSDYRLILDDPQVDAVFIVVGHHLHARFVVEALEAGKHVFVEKPLAMNLEQLDDVARAARAASDRMLMVGFNRRFSPHIEKMRELLAGRSEPLSMSMNVNAGAIPPDHWVHDPQRGGGRIIGEGCHFIDLVAHLAGSPVATVSAMMIGEGPAVRDDKMSILLGLADGSIATVNYFSNGPKSFPKESLEVYSEGRVLRMVNFRQTNGYGFSGFRRFKTPRQDKGHKAEITRFIERLKQGGQPLISLSQMCNVTRASFAAVESARTGETIQL